jgi:cobalt/nickel transport system ATP-binding protein
MSDPVFQVQDVVYRYKRVTALNHLSLTVKQGESVALLGANGSGKSTLLRILAGLAFPESGYVSFHGGALTQKQLDEQAFSDEFRKRVGVVFQNSDVQLFNPTVFDEVAFGPLQLRWPREQIRKRVTDLLELMGIEHLKDRPPHRLSGGEKKRVALASSLILDPDVLLLDEPSAALDPASQSQILDFLVSWRKSSRTVLVATHDLDNLEDIADRCVVFENGCVAAEGAPLQILHDIELLERTRLVRPHRHTHDSATTLPHGHVHYGE